MALLLVAIPHAAVANKAPSPEEIGGLTTAISADPSNSKLNVIQRRTHRGKSVGSHGRARSSQRGGASSGRSPVVQERDDVLITCYTGALASLPCLERIPYTVVMRGTPAGVNIPPFTITDLASFSPAAATTIAEPNNLGIAGLPTNFTADAAAHIRNGTLFGYPISVRFTPASFTFHYGDGDTRASTTAGKTWHQLKVPQFTPTDTSHTYAKRGTYHAHVDTAYTAEVDLGIGWFPVSGALTIAGPTQDIRIYEARTALVAHTCTETPNAPGC